MKTNNPIDYKEFKIEVFSPDGTFINNCQINSKGVFYYPGLTPSQQYVIVFSYNNILLLVADFICDTSSNVVYLSPAHFVFNKGISTIPLKAGNELTTMIKRREEFKIPFQQWEKKIIENYISSYRGVTSMCGMKYTTPRFKAGAALAKAVK